MTTMINGHATLHLFHHNISDRFPGDPGPKQLQGN